MQELDCLKIHPEWLSLILNGEKDYEVKRTGTEMFHKIIALGNTKTKKVEGYGLIVGAQKVSVDWLKTFDAYFHTMVPAAKIEKYANGKDTLWVWCIRTVFKEPNPYPYKPSCGPWGKALAMNVPPINPHCIMGGAAEKFMWRSNMAQVSVNPKDKTKESQ